MNIYFLIFLFDRFWSFLIVLKFGVTDPSAANVQGVVIIYIVRVINCCEINPLWNLNRLIVSTSTCGPKPPRMRRLHHTRPQPGPRGLPCTLLLTQKWQSPLFKFYTNTDFITQKICKNIFVLNWKLLNTNLKVIHDKRREVWDKCREIKKKCKENFEKYFMF